MKLSHLWEIVAFVFLLSDIQLIMADCCYTSKIHFVNKKPGVTCYFYDKAKTIRINPGNCKVPKVLCSNSVCKDGGPPGSGWYCGKGSCNMFGCNCDNGCRDGPISHKPHVNFINKYSSDVLMLNDVCPDLADSLSGR